ncbi:hypothetical protein GRI62_00035 [Erythrobacter arachoides]|uniref:Uncharacterized protein n=1 Tax=Aurantiacibacter arachoides TaxID=1850444 RepID=A0A844ZX08_9SPHN|nr:hypothetical protein [Aurantiacibacter arachoides]MXO91994.1 hypothetical protein [Aurantiacibacter arachoides]GGD60583.1 hypothetical protein GCM10011411_20980 [Aurantiacibacter arachoides]
MTRRQKLTWFALGALVSGIASSAVVLLDRPEPSALAPTDYLVLIEPTAEMSGQEPAGVGFIAERTGQLLQDCGAWYFETTPTLNHRMATADLPFVRENLPALACVYAGIAAEGIEHRIESRATTDFDAVRASQRRSAALPSAATP